nr:hypothetical protein [Tanacetum cinerariifolium]
MSLAPSLEIATRTMIMLKISSEGARDIVKISATSHRKPRGLLSQCARYGNLDALSTIGKALVKQDLRFWNMVMSCEDPLCLINRSFIYPLEYARLAVRIFILHATSEDIAKILWPLRDYMMAANPQAGIIVMQPESIVHMQNAQQHQKTNGTTFCDASVGTRKCGAVGTHIPTKSQKDKEKTNGARMTQSLEWMVCYGSPYITSCGTSAAASAIYSPTKR